ncbi:MAG TPA: hypothetical protein PKK00_09950 [Bacteroidales bacterium]|nr:hypothetical protein [Bacteroidales bacterium]HPS17657.1 hypothetical protein [Bacteroidales bacterium]
MEAIRNYTDSTVYGKNFLDIRDFNCNENFEEFEKEYVKKYEPFYVAAKLPIENISDIHCLERYGFRFIETQIRETLKLKDSFSPFAFFPYDMKLVSTEAELNAVLDIAGSTFRHDRFSVDPLVPQNFSGDRYKSLVKQSFKLDNEYLYKLINTQTKEILGFKTHKIISENEALMYLGGIAEKYKRSPLPAISGYLELNKLFEKGVRKITTHISGSNYGVLNLEVKEFGYKVSQAFVVLRKIYQ